MPLNTHKYVMLFFKRILLSIWNDMMKETLSYATSENLNEYNLPESNLKTFYI